MAICQELGGQPRQSPKEVSQRPVTEVAVGVVFSADRRQVLFGQRPAGKPYAGWWEFPGGKLEQGESVQEALIRELEEELGIIATDLAPWAVVEHSYPHAFVRLHFCRVFGFSGKPVSREQQALAWADIGKVALSPLLPATAPVLEWLALPTRLVWTRAATQGSAQVIHDIERLLTSSPNVRTTPASLGIVLDEPALTLAETDRLVELVSAVATLAKIPLIVSTRYFDRYRQLADGVHVSREELVALKARPRARIVGATCLNAADIALAAQRQLNYIQLETANGWDEFRGLAATAHQPVYASFNESMSCLEQAWQNGAHGVSGYL